MAEIYDTDRFGQLYYSSRQPSADHLFLAAKHLSEVCQRAAIPHAFLGGWTVRLRGGSRDTQDVDITVCTTMEHFKQVVISMPRICFPQTHGQTAVNLFVHTGKSYDHNRKDIPDLAVQVDVIIGGQLNSPSTIDNNTTETLTSSDGFNVPIVNTFYLLRGKFNAFMTRGQTNTNDYQDLVFLITRYWADVSRFNSSLDKGHRQAFLQKYAETNAGNANAVQWMTNTLGLNEQALSQSSQPATASEWVWDANYRRYRRLVNGKWEWAPA